MSTRGRSLDPTVSRKLLAALGVLALTTSMLTTGATDGLAQSDELTVTQVEAIDDKTVEVTFDRQLGARILELADGNPNYLRNYLRIDGDGTLDGSSLAEIPGSSVRAADVSSRDRLQVVLGDATLIDTGYELWFDGDGLALGDDLFLTAADGTSLAGTQTPPVSFDGAAEPATTASIDAVDAHSSRVLSVTFEQSILDGMPAGDLDGDGIVVTGADPGAVTHAVPVAGSDRREWVLYLDDDLAPGADYELTIDGDAHALTTAAGELGDESATASFVGAEDTTTPARIVSASTDEHRDEVVLTFDRKLAVVDGHDGEVEVIETPGGTSGVVLTADDVRAVVDLDADVVDADDESPLAGTASDHLVDVAAYFPDRSTLVVRLDRGARFERGSIGTVALRAGTATDVTALTSEAADGVDFAVPAAAVPAPDTPYGPDAEDYLDVDADATVEFLQNEFVFTDAPDDYSVRPENVTDRLVNEEIPAIVVENKYIEATFVPEYGARLLSLIYKPTGNDLLYTNPVGVPYGFTSTPPGQRGNSPFYHNWLMVWGGVFPTVTEAEHGKYWFLPWDYEITETDDEVRITMSIEDDLHYDDAPWAYTYGATGIETEVVYTVPKGQASVDMAVSVHNPGDESREYEYWVSATMAPGAASDAGSSTMEVVSNVETVQHIGWSPWMADVEEPAPGERMLFLDKLNRIVNWSNLGIAYGQDLATLPQGDWWGVVNHENSEGVVRVSDNSITPGMKFWMWGHELSFDTSIYQSYEDSDSSSRPYIELWGGTSEEFFAEDVLAAGETKSWTESYLPTMDLSQVTNATAHGAADVWFSDSGGDLTVTGEVFSTHVGQALQVELVDVDRDAVLVDRQIVGDPHRTAALSADAAQGSTVRLVLRSSDGDVLLEAERTHDPDPVVAVLDPPVPDGDDGWYVSPVTLSLETTDEDATPQWRPAGSDDWSTWTEPVVIDDDAVHEIEYRALSDDGDPTDTFSVTIPVDRTPPVTVATVTGDEAGDAYLDQAIVTLDAQDETSGVAASHVRIDDGEVQDYLDPVRLTGEGERVVEFRSRDAAGNVEAWRRVDIEIVTDGPTPPTSVCDRHQGGASFPDAVGSGHESTIACLAQLGIVVGKADGRFYPGDPVTRAQLASLVVRAVELATDREMPTGGVSFPDVGDESPHSEAIAKLRHAGIVQGFADGTFRPSAPVKRDQTARYVVNALEQVLDRPLATSGAALPDVPRDSPFLRDIDKLVTAEVISGFRDGTFGPRRDVTRGQMTRFVGNALEVLASEGAYAGP